MKKGRRKRLGQHFLKDHTVLRKIISLIQPSKEDLIIEIGAGKGALTFPISSKAGRVIAIEKDWRLASFLKREDLPNLSILVTDVLKIDFKSLLAEEVNDWKQVKLVGNLPYSISSPLLFKVLEMRELFPECYFLLQKEVAQRICSQPGRKKYAPISILFQMHFSTEIHSRIPAESFSPPPKVDSALISLRRRVPCRFQVEDEKLFQEFLRGSFKHRRKTFWNNLERYPLPVTLIREAFERHSLDKNVRPEQLSISQYAALFRFFLKSFPTKG